MVDERTPVFDVVSVRSSGSSRTPVSSSRGFTYSGGRVTSDQPLRGYIQYAYSIAKPWQLVGPDWLDDDKYDIQAIFPPITPKSEVRLMFRAMLAERFGLVMHQESRTLSVLALLVERSGPKFHRAQPDAPDNLLSGGGVFQAKAISMGGLASNLSAAAERPVVDATGLSGLYEIDVKWTPEMVTNSSGPGRHDVGMLTVLRDQLGLRLEPQKMPFPVWVIDHIARTPTPN